VETEGKVKRLAELFKRSDVKMYFFFLEFILGPLNEFNTTFQVSILLSHTSNASVLCAKSLNLFLKNNKMNSCKYTCMSNIKFQLNIELKDGHIQQVVA
jgi:hypothetical protein